jgi:hypothetical protein
MEVIDAREAVTEATFADAGAVVYHLKAVPWQAPGFTVAGCRDALRGLHAPVPLAVSSRPFLLECRAPA